MDLFNVIADTLGVSVSQVTFLSTQIVSLGLAVLFRTHLAPYSVSTTVRHLFGGTIGLILLYWCYGWYLLHMVAQCVGVYGIMVLLPHHINYKLASVFAMIYLTYVQITRIRGLPSFSSPVMFGTTKLVGLVFCIHDGVHKKWESLTPYQKRYAIRRYPTFLEVFGYVFHFSGVICGPTFFFQEYNEFITGHNYLCDQYKDQSSIQNNNSNGKPHRECDIKKKYQEINPTPAVLKKVLISIVCLGITLGIYPIFPTDVIADWSFINSHGFLYRVLYTHVSFLLMRYRFYFAWSLGEAIQNAAGLGIHYVNGNPQWDLTTNVHIRKLDTPTSLKDLVDNWHITAAKWLRLVAYERTGKYGLVSTFVLSALWHGIEPGFYFSAITVTFITVAARKVRRTVRPHIVDTKWKRYYDVFTGVCGHSAVCYSLGGYQLLRLDLTIRYFTYSMYWWMHLITLLIIVLPVPSYMVKKKEKSN